MYAILLFLAAVGGSFMLCASRGWALTSGPVSAANDLLFMIGIGCNNMRDAVKGNLGRTTYTYQKYIAYAIIAGVILACIPLYMSGKHYTAVIVIGATLLLCNLVPYIFHMAAYDFYAQFFEKQNSDSDFFEIGADAIQPTGPEDPEFSLIPQDQVISVGQGGMLYVAGLMVGMFGGYIGLAALVIAVLFC